METFSALLAFCAVTGEFPAQKSVTRSFGIFFDLGLNQQLSKQWRRRWFETPSCSLWRHCNVHELHKQVSTNKTILVWNIRQHLSHNLHKTPCYGSGRQLWCVNGRSLYLAPTTKFPTWRVERVSVGTALWKKYVISHRVGIPLGISQWNLGNIIWIRVLRFSKIISL